MNIVSHNGPATTSSRKTDTCLHADVVHGDPGDDHESEDDVDERVSHNNETRDVHGAESVVGDPRENKNTKNNVHDAVSAVGDPLTISDGKVGDEQENGDDKEEK